MNIKNFLSRNANTAAENRLLRFVVVVLGAAFVINTVGTIYALNHSRTVIIPPGMKEKTVIEGEKVDAQYVLSFARYIVGLAFCYTPATVKPQYEELLLYYDPAGYPKGKQMFYELAERVVETKVASVFHPQRFEVDLKKSRIEVLGNRLQMVDDRTVESGGRTYIIEYKVNNGKFSIVNIAEKQQ